MVLLLVTELPRNEETKDVEQLLFLFFFFFFFLFLGGWEDSHLAFPGSLLTVLYLMVRGEVVRDFLDSPCFTPRCQLSGGFALRNGVKAV